VTTQRAHARESFWKAESGDPREGVNPDEDEGESDALLEQSPAQRAGVRRCFLCCSTEQGSERDERRG